MHTIKLCIMYQMQLNNFNWFEQSLKYSNNILLQQLPNRRRAKEAKKNINKC